METPNKRKLKLFSSKEVYSKSESEILIYGFTITKNAESIFFPTIKKEVVNIKDNDNEYYFKTGSIWVQLLNEDDFILKDFLNFIEILSKKELKEISLLEYEGILKLSSYTNNISNGISEEMITDLINNDNGN